MRSRDVAASQWRSLVSVRPLVISVVVYRPGSWAGMPSITGRASGDSSGSPPVKNTRCIPAAVIVLMAVRKPSAVIARGRGWIARSWWVMRGGISPSLWQNQQPSWQRGVKETRSCPPRRAKSAPPPVRRGSGRSVAVVTKVTSSGKLAHGCGPSCTPWSAPDSRPGRSAVVVGKPFAHLASALANLRSRSYGDRGSTDAERLMDQGRQAAPALEATGRRLGAIVRSVRTAQGLTLAELGERTGYSAAQVSRYERGIAPLTDIAVLRRLAGALAIAPETFGLAPAPVPGGQRPRASTSGRISTVTDAGGDGEDGEHPARRRL